MWNLVMSGWRHWNRGSQFSGRTVGARIRRWWWEVNNWKVPAKNTTSNSDKVRQVEEYFVDKLGSGGLADD